MSLLVKDTIAKKIQLTETKIRKNYKVSIIIRPADVVDPLPVFYTKTITS